MKWLRWLLVLVPIVLTMEFTDAGSHTLMFVLSALALVPLAAVLGEATEEVAHFTGPKIGGFLNATLGNAAELIITIVALRAGLVDVVKASIAGSIVGNVLAVLGLSLLLGGFRHGIQKFDAHIAGINASIMSLAVMALMIPAIFALGAPEHRPTDRDIVRLSDGTAIILLALYALYLLYTIFLSTDVRGGRGRPAVTGTAPVLPAEPIPAEASDFSSALTLAADGEAKAESVAHDAGAESPRSLTRPLIELAISTLAIVFMSEVLVGALEPTAEQWGLSDLFVGVMLVPLVGNIAEHLVAVTMAMKNQMDLSMGIAVGSAVQIAMFVAPVLVLVSQFVGSEPMTLVFNSFELMALVASIFIVVMISVDGRSNWMEGAELLALYLIIAIAFFFVP